MAVLAMITAILVLPEVTAAAALDCAKLAVGVVLPSLFPMLVLSQVLVSTGVVSRLGAIPSTFAIGLLSGYPVGASVVEELARRGIVTRDQAARMLPWCNNTGPAFIVGVVGAAIWGSPAVGWLLYACHAASAAIVGFLSCRSRPNMPQRLPVPGGALRFPEALTEGVKKAAVSCINITAFIVFFGVIIALVEHFTGPLPPLVAGCIEMTQGVRRAAEMSAPVATRLAIQSGLMGFAGVSVYFQVRSVTTLPTGPYLRGKLLQAVIAATLTWVFAWFLPLTAPVMAAAPVGGKVGIAASAIIVFLYTFM